MDLLDLTGGPYERGVAQGRHHQDFICDCVDQMRRVVRERDVAWSSLLRRLRQQMAKRFPQLLAEIDGIAAGAGLPADEVLLFNNRDAFRTAMASCSALAVFDGTSLAVGMNKDISGPPGDCYFIRRTHASDAHDSIRYAHAGKLWGYGVNAAGLCAAGTAVNIALPGDKDALGLYFVGPAVLAGAESVPEAIEMIRSAGPYSGAGNILLASGDGTSAVVEVAGGRVVVRWADNHSIATANHYASGQLPPPTPPGELEESQQRLALIEAVIAESTEAPLATAQAALRAHTAAASVCRHNVLNYNTVFSWTVRADPSEMHVCEGYPCRGDYETYALNR